MLTVNLLITCICLFVVFKINCKFIRPALMNNERFKLFSLRDQLAILAMKDIISPCDSKYLFLMKSINTTIDMLDKFSLVDYLKYLSFFMNDKKTKKSIFSMVNSLKKHKNEDVARIACSYFEITHSSFEKHTRVLRIIIFPIVNIILIPVLKLILEITKLFDENRERCVVVDTIETQTHLVKKIDYDLGSTIDKFRGVLSCS